MAGATDEHAGGGHRAPGGPGNRVTRARRRRWRLGALMLAGCLVATGCGGGDQFASFAALPPSGWGGDGATADLGLRPAPDGLGFPNSPNPDRTFDAGDLIAMFGPDGVCETPTGPCVVRPEAQHWADTVAAALAGGVCEGMAVLSLDRFSAGATPASADLVESPSLNRTIRRLFATQFLPQVIAEGESSRGRPLRSVVDDVEARLTNSGVPVTIGLYANGVGHAVTPYAVERVDADRAVVWVYDPNWPGQDRFIEMDLEAQRWRFPYGEADPTAPQSADGPATVWFGDATDIDVVALSAREAPFLEPFTGAGGGRPQLAVTTSGRNWSVTGQRTGALVAGPASTPGDDDVRAVIRGGFGTTTMLAEATGDEPLRISTEASARVAVTVGRRSLTLDFDGAGAATVQADGGRIVVDQLTGDTAVTVTAPGGIVRFASPVTGPVAVRVASDTVTEVDWGAGANTSGTVRLDGDRRDLAVGTDGALTTVATPQWPESVRSEQLTTPSEEAATTSTSTTSTTTTVPPTRVVPGASPPVPTTATAPTTTPREPPTTTTPPPTSSSTTMSTITPTTKDTTTTTKGPNGGR